MRYYAARHTHDLTFAYPDGWTAYVFNTRKDRDNWIYDTNSDDSRMGHNQRSEAVTRDVARKIAGSRVRETPMADDNGHMLIEDNGYYNPHYWG